MARRKRHPIPRAMDMLNDRAIATDEWISEADGNPDTLAEMFAEVDDTIRVMLVVRDLIKIAILRATKYEDFPFQIPSGGMLNRRGGKEVVAYDNEAVVGAFVAGITQELLDGDHAARVLSGDGEIVPVEQVVDRIVQRMVAATGAGVPSFKGWRSTIASALGVNLKAYADTKRTDVTLSVEGRRSA